MNSDKLTMSLEEIMLGHSLTKKNLKIASYLLSLNKTVLPDQPGSLFKKLITEALNPSLFLAYSWVNIHRQSAVVLRKMINKGLTLTRKDFGLVDNLVAKLEYHFFELPPVSQPLELTTLSDQSELFFLLANCRLDWHPPGKNLGYDNHYTFTKSQQQTISTFLLLHHKQGVSRLHSDLWGIIYSFLVPRFPISSYLHFI